MTQKDSKISDEACRFIRTNKRLLIERFADLKTYPPTDKPVSIFMAGSPGAGKTEFSKNFNQIIISKLGLSAKAVRIDADEIKTFIPQYKGNNSDEVKHAAIVGVEKLYDHAILKKQNVIVDGTLSKYDVGYKNIARSLHKGREVGIIYLYQDPVVAWEFTKKREAVEGRSVPKKFFIDSFFSAQTNVDKLKKEFGEKIIVSLVEKNFENKNERMRFNISSIDRHLKTSYDRASLEDKIKENYV